MLYLLDANVIITAKDNYYAVDQVPEFWEWLIYMASNDRIKVPFEILDEISPGSNKEDAFHKWRKDKRNHKALLLQEEADPQTVQRILDEGYGPNLNDSELGTIGQDPFLMAYAIGNPERTVVTVENSAPSKQRQNRKIPDVCDQFGIHWIDTFRLTRILGWSTRWTPED